jgi:hypothetical protein
VQAETGEGPCLDAVYEEQTVRIPDMRTETRWPTLGQRALEAGAGSMLSLQLYVPRGQPRCRDRRLPRGALPTTSRGSSSHR